MKKRIRKSDLLQQIYETDVRTRITMRDTDEKLLSVSCNNIIEALLDYLKLKLEIVPNDDRTTFTINLKKKKEQYSIARNKDMI